MSVEPQTIAPIKIPEEQRILLANLTYLTGDEADGRSLRAPSVGQTAEGRNKEKGEKLNSSYLHTSAASCLLPSGVQFLIY